MPEPIQISMLGSFSIRLGDRCVDDHSNRMRKVWLLLAYMIYNRNARCTQEQYMTLLQSSKGTEDFSDPSGRMKALFYRARAMLDQLYPGAGHDLIVRKNGTYCWNTEFPVILDTEEFERLRTAPAETEDARLEQLLQALAVDKRLSLSATVPTAILLKDPRLAERDMLREGVSVLKKLTAHLFPPATYSTPQQRSS